MTARTLALRILAGVIVAIVIGGITLSLALNSSEGVDKNAQDIDRNSQRLTSLREAIRVSCIVTANVVTMAGGESRDPGGPTGQPARLSAQQRLSRLRIRVIERAMTPGERRLQRRLISEIAVAGGFQVPDCKRIAEHPEDVKLYVPNTSTTRANP